MISTIEEIMRSRRSIRRFKPQSLDRKLVEELIDIAITAPSASNKQPWRFFATDNKEVINLMATAVESSVERIARHIDKGFMETFQAYGDYFVRFREAPVVIVAAFREIVVLSNLVDSTLEQEDLENIRIMEFNSGLASISLAIENMLLYGHSIGLGASCMTGPLVALKKLKSIMGIPLSWHIAAVIAVGYPDEEPKITTRKSASTVLRWVNQPTRE